MNSKSFTGFKMFHGEEKKICLQKLPHQMENYLPENGTEHKKAKYLLKL